MYVLYFLSPTACWQHKKTVDNAVVKRGYETA